MRKNYLKKGFIVGVITGSILAISFLGFIYYVSKIHIEKSEKVGKNKHFKDLGIQLTKLDGTPLDLSKFSDKYIFMNFWATWCAPCIKEMPLFQRTYKSVEDKYVFIMVADHDLEQIKNFKEKNGYDFIFVRSNKSLQSTIGILPTTLILDHSQNVIFKQSGSFDPNPGKFKKLLLQKIE